MADKSLCFPQCLRLNRRPGLARFRVSSGRQSLDFARSGGLVWCAPGRVIHRANADAGIRSLDGL